MSTRSWFGQTSRSARKRNSLLPRERRVFRRRILETLERRYLLASDFGDAPAPYPTLTAEFGAQHTTSGLTLGSQRDAETDGVHSIAADGDDISGSPDDEDGVTFGTVQVGALDASVTVNVQGAAGKLDAWIDFNGDGNWGGEGEQIFSSLSVSTGDNLLQFDVPAYALSGTTYARFRLSTAGDLGPAGQAVDGEVEDYSVTIIPPASADALFLSQKTIGTTAPWPVRVEAADVDGDGDLDVLSASDETGKIAWHENDGNQNFTAHTITTNAQSVKSFQAADVDGDGDLDVLGASGFGDKIAWYENDGSQNFTTHTIATPIGAESVQAADVDGDGDLDVLSAYRDTIAWYENDGNENFTARTIDATFGLEADSVQAADVDSDGDLDVLIRVDNLDWIAWYENDGSQNFTARTIATPDGPRSVRAADVDGDGDLDVLSASFGDNKIAWYENDGTQNFTAHTITTNANWVRSVQAADVDGDGDLDVLSVSYTFEDSKIAWYENDGSQNFTARTISTNAYGAQSVQAADVDGDGDLDVLSTYYISEESGKITWYENEDGDVDFGDAPSPYPTLLANGGAYHVAIGPMLGALRDGELDGQADDGADEDGVTFGTVQVGALDASVTVNVQGAAGKLDAWIDFNGDGSWGGEGEQIFSSLSVSIGDNLLLFDVPAYALSGTTYARFRLSTAGDLGPARQAVDVDGEVEDYSLTIIPPASADALFLSQNTISTNVNLAWSVQAADLDGDGDLDVIGASERSESPLAYQIVWYENDGSENFIARPIATIGDGGSYSIQVADVDGDGDLDVLSASAYDGYLNWYENDGNQNFTRRLISFDLGSAQSIQAADLDHDGDLDVLVASVSDDEIAWFENDGSQNFTRHTITTSADAAYSVQAADVDGDGDLDVLSASAGDNKIAWYENDGSQNFTPHTIATTAVGAIGVQAADVDGDGDLDVLSASLFDDRIAWYENDGSENFTPHTITTTADGAMSVQAADVDGDGDLDVLSASFYDDKVAWYENDGSQNFSARTITNNAIGAVRVQAADVDGDGDLDVLSASAGDGKIAWYTNTDIAPTASIAGPSSGVPFQPRTFTLTATDPSPGDQGAGFTFDIDWDGDDVVDQTVVGLSGTQVTHAYESVGAHTIKVTASDQGGAVSDVVTHAINIVRVQMQGTDLVWGGTVGKDAVEFEETAFQTVEIRAGLLDGVVVSDTQTFVGVTGQLIAFGGDDADIIDAGGVDGLTNISATLIGGRGDDTINGGDAADTIRGDAEGDGSEGKDTIDGGGGDDLIYGDGMEGAADTIMGGDGNDTIYGDNGDISADGAEGADVIYGNDGDDMLFGGRKNDTIFGGDGNDIIDGQTGHDILSGGAGDDTLSGGDDRDLLFAGVGADTLHGNGGDDLLVAGSTSFDFSESDLKLIRNEWVSIGNYATRVANIGGTPGGANDPVFLQPNITVFDDGEVDTLFGDGETDWFLYNQTGLIPDLLSDLNAGEVETDIA